MFNLSKSDAEVHKESILFLENNTNRTLQNQKTGDSTKLDTSGHSGGARPKQSLSESSSDVGARASASKWGREGFGPVNGKGRRYKRVKSFVPTSHGSLKPVSAEELADKEVVVEVLSTQTVASVLWQDGTLEEDIPSRSEPCLKTGFIFVQEAFVHLFSSSLFGLDKCPT